VHSAAGLPFRCHTPFSRDEMNLSLNAEPELFVALALVIRFERGICVLSLWCSFPARDRLWPYISRNKIGLHLP
jgi:hypothetical protein